MLTEVQIKIFKEIGLQNLLILTVQVSFYLLRKKYPNLVNLVNLLNQLEEVLVHPISRLELIKIKCYKATFNDRTRLIYHII